MKHKRLLSLIAVAVLGLGLSGCGGGSTSTGAAGGGGGTRAANLIVRVNNSTAGMQTESQNRLASAISDLLARKAYAALAGNDVCVVGTDAEAMDVLVCGTTDDSGQVSLSVPPGSGYQVCVNGTMPEDCTDLGMDVGDSQVVVATVEDGDQVMLVSAEVQDAPAPSEEPEPTIADFPDPDHPDKKVIICHKPDGNNPHTISVATQAAEHAHLNHGDTPGPCETQSTANNEDENDNEDENENEGEES